MSTPFARLHRCSIRLPRPLWIGVAALVLIVLAVGLEFGLPIYRQQVAIRKIERLGGTVEMSPRGPQWLRGWVGEDGLCRLRVFDRVVGVSLIDAAVTNSDTAVLSDLTELEVVHLNGTATRDSHLNRLRALQNLRVLSLARTLVTDAGVCELRNLPSLEVLCLYGTQVSDPAIDCLKEFTGLEDLDLRTTHVSSMGLDTLKAALPGCYIQPEFKFD